LGPLTLAILGALGYFGLKREEESDQTNEVLEKIKDATKIPVPPLDRWVKVEGDGALWLVSPMYIAPVGIGEALKVAKMHDAQLPTPALVNAIWNQADLKLEPNPRAHDGTFKTMNSAEMNITQLAHIKGQIDRQSPNNDFKLLAGSHKDVVIKDGKLGLYGWHKLNGKVIQDHFTGHGLDWKDYSQGARLVKKL